jgi:hypothetical protein
MASPQVQLWYPTTRIDQRYAATFGRKSAGIVAKP